jgi:hypothetical protein
MKGCFAARQPRHEAAMSTITDTIQNAQRRAAESRPKVGGFPGRYHCV